MDLYSNVSNNVVLYFKFYVKTVTSELFVATKFPRANVYTYVANDYRYPWFISKSKLKREFGAPPTAKFQILSKMLIRSGEIIK